jgi:predicted DNA-binding transcriptional regulator AlpA
MLDRFIRKAEAIAISGLGYTQFHEHLKTGRFPPPDGYVGPRSPFWTETTLREWQRQQFIQPKQPPMQTPRRRSPRRRSRMESEQRSVG